MTSNENTFRIVEIKRPARDIAIEIIMIGIAGYKKAYMFWKRPAISSGPNNSTSGSVSAFISSSPHRAESTNDDVQEITRNSDSYEYDQERKNRLQYFVEGPPKIIHVNQT